MSFIQNINALLVEKLGPMGPLIAVGGLGLLLVLVALPVFLNRKPDPMAKFQQSVKGTYKEPKAEQRKTLRQRDPAEKLQKFAAFLEPQTAEELSSAKLKMMQAGYRGKSAVRTYHFATFAFGIGFLLFGLILALIKGRQQELTLSMMLIYTILPGGAGYYLPKYWVERRRQTRQQEIINGFPDGLDMMLVCVEAGQSLDQSIIRVSKELRAGHPALAEEFEIVAQEVKAGKDRTQVLKDMAERAGVPDVASFVTVMIQSATFGTSIAEALRVYASEMRDKRVMRAEEKANVLPTKLTLGTMLFTVPPLMIILIGPSIFGIAKTLSGAGF